MKLSFLIFFVFINFFVFSQLPSYVPKDGLVGYWLFDGNANDVSGKNNHGSVKGAVLTSGRSGVASTAYAFNGNDNTIEIPHNSVFNFDTAFTINLWIKLPSNQINNPVSYVSKFSMTQKSGFIFPYINEGNAGFGLNITTENGTFENAAGQGQFQTSQITSKTSWHQYTAVFLYGEYSMYIDGFKIKSNSGLGKTLVINTNNLIFGNSTGNNQFAKGSMDEIGIWNRALSENEIISLNGCVAPLAKISATSSTSICPGGNTILNANSGANLTYQWHRNDTIIQGATAISYTASSIGDYTVIVKSGPCPTKSVAMPVTFQLPNNLPYNPFGDTVKSCINDVVLDAGAGFLKYVWDDNSTNQKLTVKQPGYHKVKITYGNNCIAYDSTYVDLVVQAKLRMNDTTICYRNEMLLTNEPIIKNVRYVKCNFFSTNYYYGVRELEIYVNGVNIAKGKSVTSNVGWGPERVTDGRIGTGWQSSPWHFTISPSSPQTLIVDLGKEYHVDYIKLATGYELGNYGANIGFTLFTSNDSNNWKFLSTKNMTDGEVYVPSVYNGYMYNWYKNDNLINNATDKFFTVKYPGAYKLEFSKNNCTSISQVVNVKYDNPPTSDGEFDPFQDTIIGCGKDLVLDAGLGYKSYLWNDSLKSQTKTITKSGSYSAIIEYGTIGCKAKDSVFVDVIKSELNLMDTTICYDQKIVISNKYYPNLRYVKFECSYSARSTIHLYEIEIYSNGKNIALGKTVQNSTGYNQNALVDGNLNSMWYNDQNLEQPSENHKPWVMVDLGAQNKVDSVIIRTIKSSSEYNLTFEVSISPDYSFWQKVGKIVNSSGDFTFKVKNDGVNTTYTNQWYKNNTSILSATQYNYTPSESGSYTLKVTKGSCEVTSAPVKITVESPTINNTAFNPFQDSIVSCGKDLVLDAGAGFKSYFWNDSTKTQIKTINKTGSYTSTVEYGTIGCKAKDSLFVDVVKSELNQKDTTICYGQKLLITSKIIQSPRYIQFECSYSGDGNQVNVNEIEVYSKGVNIAHGKMVSMSSGYNINGINDGNPNPWGWYSDRGAEQPSVNHKPWVKIDLGDKYVFDSVIVRTPPYGGYEQSFEVKISSDNLSWYKIGDILNSKGDFTFKVNSNGLHQFKWYKNDNIISTANESIYQVKETGIYTLKVKKDACEVTSAPVKITVESPTINNTKYNPFQDSIVSCGKDLVLDAGAGFKSYFWNDSTKSQTKTISKTGNYTTTIEYGTIGCKAKDSVFVDVVKSELNQKDTTICYGNSITLINKNIQPGIRFVKFDVTSSLSNSLIQYLSIFSNGVNVSQYKPTFTNKGSSDGVTYGKGWWLYNGIPFPTEVDPASLVIDLGKVYEKAEKINTINLQTVSTLNYTIYVSSDNVNWSKLVSEKQVNGSKSYNLDNFYLNDTNRNYQWYINNKIIPLANKFQYDAKVSGTYNLKVTKGNCELISNSVKIIIDTPNVLPFNPLQDSIISCGNELILDAGDGFTSYEWSNQIRDRKNLIKTSGNYSITVGFGKNNCKISDQAFVHILKSSISPSDSILSCKNNDSKLLSYSDKEFNRLNKYQWFKDGDKINDATNDNLTTSSLGTYQLEVSRDFCKIMSSPVVFYTLNKDPDPLPDELIGCGNNVILDVRKYSNTYWKLPDAYTATTGVKWIADSVLKTIIDGNYMLNYSYKGCSFTDSVKVVNINVGIRILSNGVVRDDIPTICGESELTLQNGYSKNLYTNDLATKYLWYKDGQVFTNYKDYPIVKDSGVYHLTASYGSCTASSQKVNLIKRALPSNEVMISGSLNLCKGANVLLKAIENDATYTWSNGSTSQQLNLSYSNPGKYSVKILDKYGCSNSSNSIIVNRKDLPSISLCMVTTESKKYKLIWNNAFADYATLNKIRIYKQNNSNSQYDMIHEQPVKDLSEYTDESSEPDSKQARYKIALVDSCNNEVESAYHNTILLTSNLGVNENVNLLWNKYEGFNYTNFEIWRSEDGSNFNFLNSVSNTSTSFIDNSPPIKGYYQIRITNPNQCTSSKRGSYSSVISNIVDKKGSAQLGLNDNEIKLNIYPNPSNGQFIIESSVVNYNLIIKEMNGKTLMNLKVDEIVEKFDFTEQLSNGMYSLFMYKDDKLIHSQKLVIID